MKYRDFDFYDRVDILEDNKGNDDKCYVQKDEVDDILNDLEDKVNSIKDTLEDYTDVDGINDILEKLNKLSDDLY